MEREQFEPPKSFREKAPIKDESGPEEAGCTVPIDVPANPAPGKAPELVARR
jgi:hypothetical protein